MAVRIKLNDYIATSVRDIHPEIDLQYSATQREVVRLATALEARYPGNWKAQVAAWERNKPLLAMIWEWLAQAAAPDLPWRSATNRLVDGWRSLTRLVDNFDETDSGLAAIFETKVKPFLEQRQANLQEWSNQLWEQENLIRYALSQTLRAQAYDAVPDDTEIDLVFVEKLDTILLTYDPALAYHASLKTYAVTLIYRAIIDKIRKLGFSNISLSKVINEDTTTLSTKLIDSSLIDLSNNKSTDLIEANREVCRVTLLELGAESADGSRLSRTRRQLMCFNLIELIINGSEENYILPRQAGQILISLLSLPQDKIVLQTLTAIEKSTINKGDGTNFSVATLQNQFKELKLSQNNLANAAQISQARRVLAARPSLNLTIAQFLSYTPYQAANQERLKLAPLKVVDYCFKNLSHLAT